MSFYTIRYTDALKLPFVVNESTTNGPANPNSMGFHPSAVSANTTLIIYGRKMIDYGGPIQQNLVYMLENFANSTPPTFPVEGQIWYRNSAGGALFVYNGTSWMPISMSGSTSSDLNMSGYKVLNVGAATTPTDAVNLGQANSLFVLKAGDTVAGALSLALAPTAAAHAVHRGYADANYVRLAGSTMTGFLTLHAAPTSNMHATTKLYVDANYVRLAGSTMTGILTLSAHPTQPMHAATKDYVDTVVGGGVGAFVSITGDTMTGSLAISSGDLDVSAGNATVSGNVTITSGDLDVSAGNMNVAGTATLGATTVPSVSVSGNITMTGVASQIVGLTAPLTASHAATKQYVDATTAPLTHVHTTVQVTHDANSAYPDSVIRDGAVIVPGFPTISTAEALRQLDQVVRVLSHPIRSEVIESPGVSASVTMTNEFVVGTHSLQVYKNGLKLIASESAVAKILFNTPKLSGELSGVGSYTQQTFNVTVGGVLFADVIVNVTTGFVGALVQNINDAFVTDSVPARAILDGGQILIMSTATGAGASVELDTATTFDPLLGPYNLFDELSDFDQTVDSPAVVDRAYKEVGTPWTTSSEITLATIPTAGDVFEFVILPVFKG